jgi:hypothetical protein
VPKTYVAYIGWIGGKEADRAALAALGVRVGIWNQEAECFDGCEVSPEVLKRLDKEWGRYIWGLTRTVLEVSTPVDEDVPF